jgi:hypothetical protein
MLICDDFYLLGYVYVNYKHQCNAISINESPYRYIFLTLQIKQFLYVWSTTYTLISIMLYPRRNPRYSACILLKWLIAMWASYEYLKTNESIYLINMPLTLYPQRGNCKKGISDISPRHTRLTKMIAMRNTYTWQVVNPSPSITKSTTYHSRFIRKGVAEVSQIFHANVLLKLLSYEEYCRRDMW